MNEELQKKLSELADQLGVATKSLWEALLTQAPITSFSTVVGVLFPVVLFLIIYFPFRPNELKDFDNFDPSRHPSHGVWLGFTIGTAIISAMSLLAFFFNMGDILAGFFNPEYWALKEIGSFLK